MFILDYINIMDQNKVEIKIQSKSEYYFNLIKKWFVKILKPLFIILIIVGTLYSLIYLIIGIVLLSVISYILKAFKG